MTVNEIIKKWKLNSIFLASKLEISKQGFSKKLNEVKHHYFSKEQKSALKSILKDMAKDINKLK